MRVNVWALARKPRIGAVPLVDPQTQSTFVSARWVLAIAIHKPWSTRRSLLL
ncbi:hypothetical protein CY34DRAFT_309608 [Suillus luteus UH-Slu-Lm8-n1]|uniref:Uncharacterized protein n=1 Tax=Suillus luteus UH-Slu-Lm8-n1 TaxID=930992 RepID=A0A0D0AGI9_9AGAM|nr:hypothetical protein CY34DRAFT_309608 [Suillus luteus UH-Slu-Lm8-n1]